MIHSLPITTIDPLDPALWISCYLGDRSKHLRSSDDEYTALYNEQDEKVRYTPFGINTSILRPLREQPFPRRRISAIAVREEESLAVGFEDGRITVNDTTTTLVHKSTVTSLYFLSPSIILSSGDFTVHVGSTPLLGHTRTVTSTAPVISSNSVLSGSLDGTVRLWDLNIFQGQIVADKHPPINKICLSTSHVFCATEAGLHVVDYKSHSAIHSASGEELTSIASTDTLLMTGSRHGIVCIYDHRSLAQPLLQFTRNTATIEDVAFYDEGKKVVVISADGLACIVDIRREPDVIGEVIGGESDCDPLRAVAVGNTGIWIGGDDGVARMYKKL